MAEKPKPETEPTEPTLEQRLETLAAELKAERDGRASDKQLTAQQQQRADLLEQTLRSIAPARTQAPSGQPQRMALPPLDPSIIAQLRQESGLESDDEVRWLYSRIAPMFAHLAQPLVNNVFGAMGGIADYVDKHDARLTKKELYDKYGDEMEQERETRRQRGEAIGSRAELLELVRTRHAADEVKAGVEAEVERRMAEHRERSAAGGAAATEGGSIEKPSPSPARPAAARVDTSARRDGESREEYVKRLEDAAGDAPIP